MKKHKIIRLRMPAYPYLGTVLPISIRMIGFFMIHGLSEPDLMFQHFNGLSELMKRGNR